MKMRQQVDKGQYISNQEIKMKRWWTLNDGGYPLQFHTLAGPRVELITSGTVEEEFWGGQCEPIRKDAECCLSSIKKTHPDSSLRVVLILRPFNKRDTEGSTPRDNKAILCAHDNDDHQCTKGEPRDVWSSQAIDNRQRADRAPQFPGVAAAAHRALITAGAADRIEVNFPFPFRVSLEA